MAKHKIDGKGKVSKGIHTSSAKTRPSGSRVTLHEGTQNNTTLRNAFMNVQISTGTQKNHIVATILDSLNKKIGIKRPNRGWTANLSPRTTSELVKSGVFA